MRTLWNEGTINFSLFRHINKLSGINFVKSNQTVLVEMTQIISTPLDCHGSVEKQVRPQSYRK